MKIHLGGWTAAVAAVIGLCLLPSSSQAEDAKKKNIPARHKLALAFVANPLPGNHPIVSMKAEGTIVKEGDVVCELDVSSLRDDLENQSIEIEAIEAELRNRKLTTEAAELALKEQEEVEAEASAVNSARRKLSGDQRTAEPSPSASAVDPLKQAIAKAKADEAEAGARLKRAVETREKLAKLVEQGQLRAKKSGRVVHARWRPRPETPEGYAILEPGAVVVEAQPLFRVEPVRVPKAKAGIGKVRP